MRIEIKNFQAIREGELEIEGITLLVGDNNNGKSSIMRALRACFLGLGMSGDGVIQDGKKFASVSLKDGSFSFSWEKERKKGAVYSWEGSDPVKAGSKVPEEIAKYGVCEVIAAKSKQALNFATQWESPFLINDPPSYLFDFFSQVRKEAVLLPVITALKTDQKFLQQELSKKEGAIKALESQAKESQDSLETLLQKFPSRSLVVLAEGAVKIAHDIEECNSLVSGIEESENSHSLLMEKQAELTGKKKEIESLLNTCEDFLFMLIAEEEFLKLSESLESLTLKSEALKKAEKSLRSVRDIEEMSGAVFEFERVSDFTLQEGMKFITEKAEMVEREMKELFAKLDICPFCERVIEHGEKGNRVQNRVSKTAKGKN